MPEQPTTKHSDPSKARWDNSLCPSIFNDLPLQARDAIAGDWSDRTASRDPLTQLVRLLNRIEHYLAGPSEIEKLSAGRILSAVRQTLDPDRNDEFISELTPGSADSLRARADALWAESGARLCRAFRDELEQTGSLSTPLPKGEFTVRALGAGEVTFIEVGELRALERFVGTDSLPDRLQKLALDNTRLLSGGIRRFFENTTADPQWQPKLLILIRDFCATERGSQIVQRLGINDLERLSVTQAIMLAGHITQTLMPFTENRSHLSSSDNGSVHQAFTTTLQEIKDQSRPTHAWACRHHTISVWAVFEALKGVQQVPSPIENIGLMPTITAPDQPVPIHVSMGLQLGGEAHALNTFLIPTSHGTYVYQMDVTNREGMVPAGGVAREKTVRPWRRSPIVEDLLKVSDRSAGFGDMAVKCYTHLMNSRASADAKVFYTAKLVDALLIGGNVPVASLTSELKHSLLNTITSAPGYFRIDAVEVLLPHQPSERDRYAAAAKSIHNATKNIHSRDFQNCSAVMKELIGL